MQNTLLRSTLPWALATVCFALPLGTFQSDSTVAPASAGHSEFNPQTGEYTLTYGGGGIAEKTDRFHYVWKRINGDATVNADVRFTGMGTNDRSQAAVMIRQSLDPDAAYAAAVLYGDGHGVAQYRVDKGAAAKMSETIGGAQTSNMIHMMIARHGDAFTFAVGFRGKIGGPLPFTQPVTVTMNGPVYVGIAVASLNEPAQPAKAVFTNVSVQGAASE